MVEGFFPLGVAIREVTEALEKHRLDSHPGSHHEPPTIVPGFLAAGADPPAKLKYSTSIGMLHFELWPRSRLQLRREVAVIAPYSVPATVISADPLPARNGPRGRELLHRPYLHLPRCPSSSGQVSQNAPSTSLATRVTQLEAQLGTVQSDVKGLRTSQEMLEKNLVDLGHRQDRGFTDLMAAIQALSAESSSSQKASPARKSLKK